MINSRQTTAGPAGPREGADGIAWREFPVLEKMLGAQTRPPVLDRIAVACRRLEEIRTAEADADKIRAALALSAFGRALDLFQHLRTLRDSNQSPAAADNR